MARGASFATLLGRSLGVIVLLSGLLGACQPAAPNAAAPAVTPSSASTPTSAPDKGEAGLTVITTQTATPAPSPTAKMTATATATPPSPPTAEVTAPPEAPPVIREVSTITNTETISSVLPVFTDGNYRQATSLENRVLVDSKTGAKLVLSEVAYNQLRSTLEDQITPEMDEKAIATLMADALSKSIWAKNLIVLEKAIKYEDFNNILLDENGKVILIPSGLNEWNKKPKNIGDGVLIIDEKGILLSSKPRLSELTGTGADLIFEKNGRFLVATTDGYQILATLKKTDQGYTWQKVPPDQLQEFKVLTPEQEEKYIIKNLTTFRSDHHETPYQFTSYVKSSQYPYTMIAVGGENGFTKSQATQIAKQIDWMIAHSPTAKSILLERSEVRFIVKDNELLNRKLPDGTPQPYASSPNRIRSIWGYSLISDFFTRCFWQMKAGPFGIVKQGQSGHVVFSLTIKIRAIWHCKTRPPGSSGVQGLRD